MRKAPKSERERTCARCGAAFYVKPSVQGKFCSRICKDESLRTKPKNDPRPCVVCGKEFRPSRHHGVAKYCSKSCVWVDKCGPEFNARISRESAERRGDMQRGRGEGKAYRKRGGRHEHRVVAEEKLGRPLRRGEVVHHIDGDKLNNDPSNLAVMKQSEHMVEHGIGVPGVRPHWEPWRYRK